MADKDTKKALCTFKKQKFVGTKMLIDPETGDEYPMQLNLIEDRDFNFTKVWLQHLVNSLDEISNQKLRLAFWIIENLDKENQLVMTQRQLAEASGISLKTVSRTMKALCEGEPAFLQKINGGAYRVNPEVMFKGSHKNRMGIIYKYQKTAQEEAQADDFGTQEQMDLEGSK